MAQMVKNLPTVQETQLRSLGQENLLEKKMATHSSIPAWRIPWTVEPGGLQSTGWQRVRHDWATNTSLHFTSGRVKPSWGHPIHDSTIFGILSGDYQEWRVWTVNWTFLSLCWLAFWSACPWHLRFCWQLLQAKLRRSLVSKKQPSPLKACLSNQQCSYFLRLSSLKYVQKFYTVFIFKHAPSCETPIKPRRKCFANGTGQPWQIYPTKKPTSCKISTHSPSHLYSAHLPIPSQNCKNQKKPILNSPFPSVIHFLIGFSFSEQFWVHSKIIEKYRDFPWPSHTHSLSDHQYLSPEWCICYNWWIYPSRTFYSFIQVLPTSSTHIGREVRGKLPGSGGGGSRLCPILCIHWTILPQYLDLGTFISQKF